MPFRINLERWSVIFLMCIVFVKRTLPFRPLAQEKDRITCHGNVHSEDWPSTLPARAKSEGELHVEIDIEQLNSLNISKKASRVIKLDMSAADLDTMRSFRRAQRLSVTHFLVSRFWVVLGLGMIISIDL